MLSTFRPIKLGIQNMGLNSIAKVFGHSLLLIIIAIFTMVAEGFAELNHNFHVV